MSEKRHTHDTCTKASSYGSAMSRRHEFCARWPMLLWLGWPMLLTRERFTKNNGSSRELVDSLATSETRVYDY